MSHLLSSPIAEDFTEWRIIPIDDHDDLELTGDADRPVKASKQHHAQSGIMLLRESSSTGDVHFVLLIHPDAKQSVRINGDPVFAGIRILRDRDEILISRAENPSQRLYFSNERKARVETFASNHEASCVRCHQKIAPGSLIVRCPYCGALHHESADLQCYSYAAFCGNGICNHPTAMDEEFSWTPDYLMGR